ncbi:RNA polymerase sigma factor [Robertkochia aurantiaca]|uniref:RNA polymerase sigma factor n=1 Tax=Robertkochia aurantiaca TaxID=2873700 RepID=UPI001CCD82A3|nr:RNA polymerase sigma factor [Robertkochia sp. 3YJGBD-33]
MKGILKVIPLYRNEEKLIQGALKGNRSAQRAIYDRYASKMLAVCHSYVKDRQFAEDVMIRGFFKVYKNLYSFEQKGSFEGWIRRIMVREAIDFLRARKEGISFRDELPEYKMAEHHQDSEILYDEETIRLLIERLPDGYRSVFLMYAVEGYSHSEIAEMLGISESTSKSQLHKARKALKEELNLLKDGKRKEIFG